MTLDAQQHDVIQLAVAVAVSFGMLVPVLHQSFAHDGAGLGSNGRNVVDLVVGLELLIRGAVGVGEDQGDVLFLGLLDHLTDGVVVDVVDHQILDVLGVEVVHIAGLSGNVVQAVGIDDLDGAVGSGIVQRAAGIGDKGVTEVVPADTGDSFLLFGGLAAAGHQRQSHDQDKNKGDCFFHF